MKRLAGCEDARTQDARKTRENAKDEDKIARVTGENYWSQGTYYARVWAENGLAA